MGKTDSYKGWPVPCDAACDSCKSAIDFRDADDEIRLLVEQLHREVFYDEPLIEGDTRESILERLRVLTDPVYVEEAYGEEDET